jgi:hypothetical protein
MLIMSSSVLQQRLGVRLEVTGAMLNHVSGSRGGLAGRLGSREAHCPGPTGGSRACDFRWATPKQPETWWRCYVQAKAVGRRLKPRPSPRRPALPAAMARHRTRLADNARHPSFPSRRKDVPKPASLQWQRRCLGLQDRDSWGYAVSNPREVRVFLELGAHRSPACGQTLGRPILPSFLPRAIHRGVKCWIP